MRSRSGCSGMLASAARSQRTSERRVAALGRSSSQRMCRPRFRLLRRRAVIGRTVETASGRDLEERRDRGQLATKPASPGAASTRKRFENYVSPSRD
eukprot:5974542-Pleurochrysis_carterae.AAC.1